MSAESVSRQSKSGTRSCTRLVCLSCGHALNIVVRRPGGQKMCFLHPHAKLERVNVFAPRRLGQYRLGNVKADVKLCREALNSVFVDNPDFPSLAQNLAEKLIGAGTVLQDLANEHQKIRAEEDSDV